MSKITLNFIVLSLLGMEAGAGRISPPKPSTITSLTIAAFFQLFNQSVGACDGFVHRRNLAGAVYLERRDAAEVEAHGCGLLGLLRRGFVTLKVTATRPSR